MSESQHRAVVRWQVLTGQEFSRVKDLPAKWLVETVLVKAARAISPSVEIGPLSTPSLLVPVVALAQCITVRAKLCCEWCCDSLGRWVPVVCPWCMHICR